MCLYTRSNCKLKCPLPVILRTVPPSVYAGIFPYVRSIEKNTSHFRLLQYEKKKKKEKVGGNRAF